MEEIIAPIDKELIKSELTVDRFLRRTNKANNEIFIVNAFNSPYTMREIGRLREIAFRNAGGGTGLEIDIDIFDTMEEPCQQLIVWNPDADEIIGGYRFILGEHVQLDEKGQPVLATAHLFHFSNQFIKEYLPYTLELGRSFVRIEYQSSQAGAKSLFALDNLWDGLGALSVKYPQIKYYFGKVTMYPSFGNQGRDVILYFLQKHFNDSENLVTPINPLQMESDIQKLDALLSMFEMKDNYKILNQEVRSLGQNIPPLVNAYMNLSNTMKVFGTAVNDDFGDVEETGILVTVDDIYQDKRDRHIETYITELQSDFKFKRFGIS